MNYVSNSKIAEWYGPPCKQPIVTIKLAGSNVHVNKKIKRLFLWQEIVFSLFPHLYKDLNERHLDDWGGMCRPVTGNSGPVTVANASKHAWWIATDIDADENVRGTNPLKSEIWLKGGDGKAVRLLEATGFTWGGRFSTPDPHHFEAAVPKRWVLARFNRRGKLRPWFSKQLRKEGFDV